MKLYDPISSIGYVYNTSLGCLLLPILFIRMNYANNNVMHFYFIFVGCREYLISLNLEVPSKQMQLEKCSKCSSALHSKKENYNSLFFIGQACVLACTLGCLITNHVFSCALHLNCNESYSFCLGSRLFSCPIQQVLQAAALIRTTSVVAVTVTFLKSYTDCSSST